MTKEAYGTFILSPHPFCLAEWGTNATEEPIYRLIISIREHNRLRHNHVVREQKPWEHKKQLDRDSILICYRRFPRRRQTRSYTTHTCFSCHSSPMVTYTTSKVAFRELPIHLAVPPLPSQLRPYDLVYLQPRRLDQR